MAYVSTYVFQCSSPSLGQEHHKNHFYLDFRKFQSDRCLLFAKSCKVPENSDFAHILQRPSIGANISHCNQRRLHHIYRDRFIKAAISFNFEKFQTSTPGKLF